MRVLKVTFGRYSGVPSRAPRTMTEVSTARKGPTKIELEIGLEEGESVVEAIRKARITVAREMGEMPTGADAEVRARIMRASASDLSAEADALLEKGFE